MYCEQRIQQHMLSSAKRKGSMPWPRVAQFWLCGLSAALPACCDLEVVTFLHQQADVTRAALVLLTLWVALPSIYKITIQEAYEWPVRSLLMAWLSMAFVAEAFCTEKGCSQDVSTAMVVSLGVGLALVGSVLPLLYMPFLLLLTLTVLAVLNPETWDVRYPFVIVLSSMAVAVAHAEDA